MKQVKYNNENPNGVLVDYTAEETANNETSKAEFQQIHQEEEAEKAQKQTDAQSGNQKLLDLGLTQAEATALTGYKPQ